MKRFFQRRFFCSQNPLKKNDYVYDKQAFEKINNKEFIQRLEKMEYQEQFSSKKQYYGIPLALLSISLGIHFLWNQMPYSKIFKHLTISEYTYQKLHVHSIFLSSLSFQNTGNFCIYFPSMVYSVIKLGSFLNNKQILSVYIANSILASITTYLYEKKYMNYKNKRHDLITPKCHGAITPLCFLTLFLTLKPYHILFGFKFLPFFVIPVTYYMYEHYEFENNHVNELCRPSHFASIGFGIFCAIYFKRIL